MSARILVVDDNPLNLKLLTAKLTHDYYIVSTAENGHETLEKAAKEKPDIILLDVMMPGMDGFEACKRLKSNPETAYIPVVMVTALSDTADRVRGLEAGADDFLTKPINDIALMSRVRSLLRLKVMMDEWRLREATSQQLGVESKPENIDISMGGRALVLEDDPIQKELISNILRLAAVTVTSVDKIPAAAEMARDNQFDLVYVSLDLRAEDGLLLCSMLRAAEATRQLPVLLVGNDSEMTRIAKGLDLGANDYLIRPIEPNELLARTRTQLKQKRHYERIRKNYEDSFIMALIDPLTGAFNRRYLDAHLPRLLSRVVPTEKPLSVVMVDIDHFKKINDTYGHPAGDAVLREVVRRMMNGLRPSDLVVRMGGEEFAVILPETDLAQAMAVSERMRERISQTSVITLDDGETVSATVSIGVSCVPQGMDESEQSLLARADAALYKAKESGRNRVVNGGLTGS